MNNSESVEVVDPAPLLEEIYRKIHQEHMLGLPVLNANLEVEAVGFTPFQGFWLGILITPWFMNLMLLSRTESCPVLAEGESQSWLFPSGKLKFHGDFETGVGAYQACSLFSPMGEFANQGEARAAAQAVMSGLFTEAIVVEPEPEQKQPVGPLAEMRAAVAAPMSKRDFLRGVFLPGRKS